MKIKQDQNFPIQDWTMNKKKLLSEREKGARVSFHGWMMLLIERKDFFWFSYLPLETVYFPDIRYLA